MKAKLSSGVLLVALMLGLIAGGVASPVVSAGTWKTDVYYMAPDTWIETISVHSTDDKCRQVDVWIKTPMNDMIWLGTRYVCPGDDVQYDAECRQVTEVHITYDRAYNPFDYSWAILECNAYEELWVDCGTHYVDPPWWSWYACAILRNVDSEEHSYQLILRTATGEEYVDYCMDMAPGDVCIRLLYEDYTEAILAAEFQIFSLGPCGTCENSLVLWGPGPF